MFSTLCHLCVLCDSVVNRDRGRINYRNTEIREFAQRSSLCHCKSPQREHGNSIRISVAVLFCLVSYTAFSQGRATTTSRPGAGALTITSEPNAIIWIDEIRRGVTDASGKLELQRVSAGRHTLRVRATGFREVTMPLLAGKGTQAVKLAKTTNQAELTFQQAEDAREKARDDASRQSAAELYRATLRLRPAYPAAHVGTGARTPRSESVSGGPRRN